MLEEKVSKHLGVKYVYLPEVKKFLCNNGVIFTLEEYKNGIDINSEYKKRSKEGKLYDYDYAKNTGLLREKKNAFAGEKNLKGTKENDKKDVKVSCVSENHSTLKNINSRAEGDSRTVVKTESMQRSNPDRRNESNSDECKEKQGFAVMVICALLAFTSVISMYISTLHTATYLYDYVDVFSSWLMSASVTAYNSTAFEVSVLFHVRKRNFMASIFMLLWITVTLFSMTTTVSVFYDRFNFTEAQIAEENKEIDSGKLALSILQKKENDLREAIKFKQKDIEYRQEREYATSAVRKELVILEEELQKNLSEQQEIMSKTPEAVKENVKKKESLFAFIGRLLHIEGGILEFIMSTLSAIFVNLIAPLSLTAVTELLKKKS